MGGEEGDANSLGWCLSVCDSSSPETVSVGLLAPMDALSSIKEEHRLNGASGNTCCPSNPLYHPISQPFILSRVQKLPTPPPPPVNPSAQLTSARLDFGAAAQSRPDSDSMFQSVSRLSLRISVCVCVCVKPESSTWGSGLPFACGICGLVGVNVLTARFPLFMPRPGYLEDRDGTLPLPHVFLVLSNFCLVLAGCS